MGRHDVSCPLHAPLSIAQSALELGAGDLWVAIGTCKMIYLQFIFEFIFPVRHTYVLLERHPMVLSVPHEAGGLVELVAADLTLVLAPVQLVVLHVGDDGLQGLGRLRLVL